MDAALFLRSGGAQLKAQLARLQRRPQFEQVAQPHVLQRVLEARREVGQVPLERALVHHGAGDALCDAQRRVGREVAVGRRALLHCVDRAHAAVLLQPDAVLVKVVARCLISAGEQRSHHHCGGAAREGLRNLADVGDAAVCPARDTVLARVLAHVVDRRRLRPADRHHLLRGADGAGAHADAQRVDSPLDQVLRLRHADNVATDDLQLREVLLDKLDHALLVRGVALRRVDDDDVDARLRQRLHAELVVRSRVHRRANQQPLVVALGRVWEVPVLAHVLARDESDELALLVDDGQLALLRVHQKLVRLLERAADLGDDEVGRHHLHHGRAPIFDKIVVARRDNADEPPAERAVLGDRDARKAVLGLDHVHVSEGGVWREAEGIEDEAVLVSLHAAHFGALLLDGVVAVDDAEAAEERHVDRHLRLGHRVHRAGDEGQVELDLLRDLRLQADVLSREVDVAG
mmetsp:Transcript_8593/g.17034  ORF Transcript_8593/g.17034 Transcript_8593/m.17034 type:complete len:462 (-) Transcript_8593:153-1538(-)